jgi:histidine triad (HIT) family protein
VPLNNVGDLNFANPKLEVASDKLAEIAAKIRGNFK